MAYRFKHGDRPVDGYVIQRAVGSGGFGEVYYAISDGGREVALKYLRDNPQVELRGVSHCINLKSPHLVSIFDVKRSEDGEYFIVMEYCSGPSLRDLMIAEPKGFAPEKAAFFVRELAKGLAYLHDRGIVHRDLKPGNIFYDDGYVKIGDYGLSKFISVSRHSAQTSSVGTVHYMAPEIGSGNYSRGVDIYAVGVILYEMLLGRVPFEGSTMGEVLMKHLMSQPQVDELPQPFAQVIRKALEKDPKDRYQTVDELVDDMLSGEEVQRGLESFAPQSLAGAVRRGDAEPRTPMPSPNPPGGIRGFTGDETLPVDRSLPAKMARRFERVGRKIERKVERLGGRMPGVKRTPPPVVHAGFGEAPPPVAEGFEGLHVSVNMPRRWLLVAAATITLGLGVGLLFGSAYREEVGASAGMMVVALSGAVPLARRVVSWLGPDAYPVWVKRLVRLVCCAPLAFIAAAPFIDKYEQEGVVAALAIIVVAVFADWTRHTDAGASGYIDVSGAMWAGLGALVAAFPASMVLSAQPWPACIVAGVTTVCAALNLQAAGWWLRRRHPGDGGGGDAARAPRWATDAAMGAPINAGRTPIHAPVAGPGDPGATPPPISPIAPPVVELSGPRGPVERMSSFVVREPSRWLLTRSLFAVMAFLCMSGIIVALTCFVAMPGLSFSDRTMALFTSVACFAGMLFSLGKTTPSPRPGFWADTLRPALRWSSLACVGGAVILLARHSSGRPFVPGPSRDGTVLGLVLCAVLFVVLLIEQAARRRPAKPQFLSDSDYDAPVAPPTPPSPDPVDAT